HVRAALETLQESTKSLFGVARGRLTISASQSIIQLWLGPRLDRLRAVTGTQISLQTLVLGGHDAPQDDVAAIRYGSGGWPHAYKLRLYAEELTPVAAPELAGTGGDWTEWPRIAVSGPRPGWAEFSGKYGIPSTPVPGLLFDTYGPAQGAARAGLGVMLASLPLCRAEIESGTLVRLSADAMTHHESYWLLAGRDAVSRMQWETLEGVLADSADAARVS
ncbi:MAG: LysR substrate-binding domain-containing protein, partial [Pseudomonadota bacterium]